MKSDNTNLNVNDVLKKFCTGKNSKVDNEDSLATLILIPTWKSVEPIFSKYGRMYLKKILFLLRTMFTSVTMHMASNPFLKYVFQINLGNLIYLIA